MASLRQKVRELISEANKAPTVVPEATADEPSEQKDENGIVWESGDDEYFMPETVVENSPLRESEDEEYFMPETVEQRFLRVIEESDRLE